MYENGYFSLALLSNVMLSNVFSFPNLVSKRWKLSAFLSLIFLMKIFHLLEDHFSFTFYECLHILVDIFINDKFIRWQHRSRNRSSPQCLACPNLAPPAFPEPAPKLPLLHLHAFTVKEIPSVWNLLYRSPHFGSI